MADNNEASSSDFVPLSNEIIDAWKCREEKKKAQFDKIYNKSNPYNCCTIETETVTENIRGEERRKKVYYLKNSEITDNAITISFGTKILEKSIPELKDIPNPLDKTKIQLQGKIGIISTPIDNFLVFYPDDDSIKNILNIENRFECHLVSISKPKVKTMFIEDTHNIRVSIRERRFHSFHTDKIEYYVLKNILRTFPNIDIKDKLNFEPLKVTMYCEAFAELTSDGYIVRLDNVVIVK
jgi:hypothetical protein